MYGKIVAKAVDNMVDNTNCLSYQQKRPSCYPKDKVANNQEMEILKGTKEKTNNSKILRKIDTNIGWITHSSFCIQGKSEIRKLHSSFKTLCDEVKKSGGENVKKVCV